MKICKLELTQEELSKILIALVTAIVVNMESLQATKEGLGIAEALIEHRDDILFITENLQNHIEVHKRIAYEVCTLKQLEEFKELWFDATNVLTEWQNEIHVNN